MTNGDPRTLQQREAAALMRTYKRQHIVFTRGEGSWLYDDQGHAYLDCLGGLAVISVGHANPAVTEAVSRQMRQLTHVSNLFYTEPQVELAERLCTVSGLDRVFFANCGATANEAAIKLARRWSQKTRGAEAYQIVSLARSFHGRTLATLAATGQPNKQRVFSPLPQGFIQVPGSNLEAMGRAIGPHTAAVLLETIQGEGGVVPFSAEYLQGVRELCSKADALMIVDDVQAGVGRTGSWFSWQSLGFVPDIATTAKALANGLPVGACLARAEVAAAFEAGDHATTFGGGPVVCRAALAVIDQIERHDLLRNCKQRADQLRQGLAGLSGVESVRGRGLLIAAQLSEPRAAEVVTRALQHGLVINNVRPNAIRFAPPLTISSDEVTEAVARVSRALAEPLPSH